MMMIPAVERLCTLQGCLTSRRRRRKRNVNERASVLSELACRSCREQRLCTAYHQQLENGVAARPQAARGKTLATHSLKACR